MKTTKPSSIFALFALLAPLLVPAALSGQDQPPQRGSIEFGIRHVWGDVYGRPDLPFTPSLATSKFNEYRDLRSNFFVRSLNLHLDNVLGSKKYLDLQSLRTVYKDQSYLATVGQYGRFKVQFRWDEIPHVFSSTSRTLYTQTNPGVFTIPLAIRSTLQATAAADLPATTQAQVASMPFFTPVIERKAGTGLASIDLTPNWNLSFLFSRENEVGTRPIGLILNSGPSASATSGYGAELPEPIDYFINTVRVGAEYGRRHWAFQVSYTGSFFENNINVLVFDNPFRATNETRTNPLTGRMDLYPDNQAHYLNFAGAFNLKRYLRVMASVTPGWLRQNDPFVPYTTNTAINSCGTGTQACSSLAVLPVSSLNGEKQTLAMNYTLVTLPWKKIQVKAAYRHYDYNNNTESHEFTPVLGDVGLPNLAEPEENKPFGYNKKTFELTGNWFFAQRSSLKLGYEGEWFDRSHRDVAHSLENSFISALDYSPHKDLLVRLAYRHQNREPDAYEDEDSDGIPCEATALAAARAALILPGIQPCARRFDEAARLRDRGDALVQFSPTDKLSFSASFSTTQDNYNRSGGANSATPLNFLTGSSATTSPYFLYGLLKDLSYTYTVDGTYTFSRQISGFAEYSHERYHRRMISRYRTPEALALSANPNGCGPNSVVFANQGPCDSANNDWESSARDWADVWSAGLDFNLRKKVTLSTYYSLAAGKGHVLARSLGTVPATFLTNPTPLNNSPDRFVMTTTSAATDYPETVNRSHEVVATLQFKLTRNVTPKLEYRYQQFDNKDYQTSAMTPYMGCVAISGVPASGGAPSIAPVSALGCPTVGPTIATPIASPFYPYFVVGDTAAARYLFLGVDQPSFRAHTVAASVVYQF